MPVLGNKVKFTSGKINTPALAASITIQGEGTFTDGNGVSGTYTFIWLAANFQDGNREATLGKVTGIQFYNSSGQIFAAAALIANPSHGAVKSLKGKTLTFSSVSTGSDGSFTGGPLGTAYYSI